MSPRERVARAGPSTCTTRETAQVWTKEAGTLRFWYPTPTIIVHQFKGHLDLNFTRIVIERANLRMAQEAKVHCFCDWAEMKSYASASRIELTKWSLAKRSCITTSSMLVSSKIIMMGITVAGVVLNGMIRPFTSREAFERELEETIAKTSGAGAAR